MHSTHSVNHWGSVLYRIEFAAPDFLSRVASLRKKSRFLYIRTRGITHARVRGERRSRAVYKNVIVDGTDIDDTCVDAPPSPGKLLFLSPFAGCGARSRSAALLNTREKSESLTGGLRLDDF